ncbi:MAG: S1 family peptidase [Mycobacteriaceae bacterium]|nr:S1 family peptidase [Mycobacteriaceae bacterium]
MRILVAAVSAVTFGLCGVPVPAIADPVLVFPGMEIHQDVHLCTLGYVDPVLKLAFTAGHCRGSGMVTDKDNNVIGRLVSFRDNTPSGSIVAPGQLIADYEAIALADNALVSSALPGGRSLQSKLGLAVQPGQAVCHFGIVSGESCGAIDSINNGWFTMSRGVISQKGDSGGPVYLISTTGAALIIGIFNSVWGEFPAAVAWQAVFEQAHEDAQAISAVAVGSPH